jgi:hypothetical protein
MKVVYNQAQFFKELENITQYALGFVEGVQKGKTEFIDVLGKSVIESLKDFIDLNARVDPQSLHHVYEWYQTGQETGRLFDIVYTANSGGLSVNSTFRQSSSVSNGANTPFYDKARIMESGIPVTIRAKSGSVLTFNDDGEQVFTKKDINVDRPGGSDVQGSFENVIQLFFTTYFTQSFLSASGLRKYLENPTAFKNKLDAGKRGGKTVGEQTGYNWIVKAGGAL